MSDESKTLTFPNYASDRYARLQEALGAKGLQVEGDSGTIEKFGAQVDYGYAGGTLTLYIHHPPYFHSMDSFCQQLQIAIQGQS